MTKPNSNSTRDIRVSGGTVGVQLAQLRRQEQLNPGIPSPGFKRVTTVHCCRVLGSFLKS